MSLVLGCGQDRSDHLHKMSTSELKAAVHAVQLPDVTRLPNRRIVVKTHNEADGSVVVEIDNVTSSEIQTSGRKSTVKVTERRYTQADLNVPERSVGANSRLSSSTSASTKKRSEYLKRCLEWLLARGCLDSEFEFHCNSFKAPGIDEHITIHHIPYKPGAYYDFLFKGDGSLEVVGGA